jgi:hypothetical protein
VFDIFLKIIYLEKIFFNILILKIKKIISLMESPSNLNPCIMKRKKKEEISTTLICYSFSYPRVYILQAASSKFQH